MVELKMRTTGKKVFHDQVTKFLSTPKKGISNYVTSVLPAPPPQTWDQKILVRQTNLLFVEHLRGSSR